MADDEEDRRKEEDKVTYCWDDDCFRDDDGACGYLLLLFFFAPLMVVGICYLACHIDDTPLWRLKADYKPSSDHIEETIMAWVLWAIAAVIVAFAVVPKVPDVAVTASWAVMAFLLLSLLPRTIILARLRCRNGLDAKESLSRQLSRQATSFVVGRSSDAPQEDVEMGAAETAPGESPNLGDGRVV